MVGLRRESSGVEGGGPRKRRESFSMDEGTNPQEMAERKMSMTQEFEARKNSILIEETIPEMAVETPSLEPVRTLGDGLPQPQPTPRPVPDRTPTSEGRNTQAARVKSPAARNGTAQMNGNGNAIPSKAEASGATKPVRKSVSNNGLKPSASKPAPKTTPAPLAATKPAPASKPASKASNTSGPRSPTTPVKGTTKTSALKEAAKAIVPGKVIEKKTSKPPSTSSNAAATRATARPSLSKQNGTTINAAADRPKSRVSAAADEGFLARMMRPTTASSSKTHEKPTTPPKRTSVPKRPTTRDGPAHDAEEKANGSPVGKSSRQSSASEMGKSHISPPHKFVKPRPKSPTRPVKLPASLMAQTAASQGKTGTVEEKPKVELKKKTSDLTKSTKGTPAGTSSVGRKPSVLKRPAAAPEKKAQAAPSTKTAAPKPAAAAVSAPVAKEAEVEPETPKHPKETETPKPTEEAPEESVEITSEMTPASQGKLPMPETEPEIPTAAKSVALKAEVGQKIHDDAVAVKEEKAAVKADETKEEPQAQELITEEPKVEEPKIEVPAAAQEESQEEVKKEEVEEKNSAQEFVKEEKPAETDSVPAPAEHAAVLADKEDGHEEVDSAKEADIALPEREAAAEKSTQQDAVEVTGSKTEEIEEKGE